MRAVRQKGGFFLLSVSFSLFGQHGFQSGHLIIKITVRDLQRLQIAIEIEIERCGSLYVCLSDRCAVIGVTIVIGIAFRCCNLCREVCHVVHGKQLRVGRAQGRKF